LGGRWRRAAVRHGAGDVLRGVTFLGPSARRVKVLGIDPAHSDEF
jgi:hypothetical protein